MGDTSQVIDTESFDLYFNQLNPFYFKELFMKEHLDCGNNNPAATGGDEVDVICFDDLPLGFEIHEAWSMQED